MGPRTAVLGGFLAAASGAWFARHSGASPFGVPLYATVQCESPPVVSGSDEAHHPSSSSSTAAAAASMAPGFFFGAPAQPPSATVASIANCSDFIDQRSASAQAAGAERKGNLWLTETTDFSSVAAVEALVRQGKAALQIMRMPEMYTPVPTKTATGRGGEGDGEKSSGDAGNPAPVMRIVGYFPGATTAQVYKKITDVPTRFAWDSNYVMFESLPKPPSDTAAPPGYSLDSEAVRRDMAAAAPRLPLCVGDVCKIVPNAQSELLGQDWLCHKVGSSFLVRLGIAPRFFRYERVGYRHCLRDVKVPPPPTPASPDTECAPGGEWEAIRRRVLAEAAVYDVLYSGSRQGVREAAAQQPALQAFLSRAEHTIHAREGDKQVTKGVYAGEDKTTTAAHSTVVPVDVNYQHIVLIPIASYREQLMGAGGSGPMNKQFDQMANSGSMRDGATTKWVYDTQTATAQIRAAALMAAGGDQGERTDSAKTAAECGTLFIMTSANDASVPNGLPMWLQRKVSSVLSHQAYGELTEALKRDFPCDHHPSPSQ